MFLGFSNLPMALSLLDASKVSICNVNRAASKAITKAVIHVAFPAGRQQGSGAATAGLHPKRAFRGIR